MERRGDSKSAPFCPIAIGPITRNQKTTDFPDGTDEIRQIGIGFISVIRAIRSFVVKNILLMPAGALPCSASSPLTAWVGPNAARLDGFYGY